MADYGAFPLWTVGDDNLGPMACPENVPLSTDLKTALEEWAWRYERVISPSDGLPPSEDVVQGWNAAGRALAQRVQHELGNAVDVVFYNCETGRVDHLTDPEE
jgi:hypothetical protein